MAKGYDGSHGYEVPHSLFERVNAKCQIQWEFRGERMPLKLEQGGNSGTLALKEDSQKKGRLV